MKLEKQPHGGKLARWAKGETGNPKGKPKGVRNRATIAREVLEMAGILPDQVFAKLKERYPTIEKEMSVEQIMTIVQADKSITKQDTYAYQALMDSAYGKPKQETELSGDMTINIPAIKWADDK